MSPWIIIVILGACAIAYACIMPRKNKAQEPGHQLVQEMESTLEHYMTEIENDNDALIQRVAEMKGEATAADQRMQLQLQELQQRLDQAEQSKRMKLSHHLFHTPVMYPYNLPKVCKHKRS